MHSPRFLSVLASLAFMTVLAARPARCQAELLPAGEFQGKSLSEWTLDWGEWAIRTGVAGQSLPDTVDGVRYLPPNLGSSFVADLTVEPGTALVFSPYFVFGERYEDGHEDQPADVDAFMLFEAATVETRINGNVVLAGAASAFPERKSRVRSFSSPIFYVTPQDRGGIDAVGAIFEVGIGAIMDLPAGEHTIQNVYESDFFGGPYSATYNVTVVPEPSTLALVGLAAVLGRQVSHRRLAMSRQNGRQARSLTQRR
jgi:hypothetical protein